MNTRDKLLQKLDNDIRDLEEKVRRLKELPPSFDDLKLEASFCGDYIDFDHLEHDQVVKVIQAIGGKWNKNLGSVEGTIDYTTTTESGQLLRCYAGKPPPNCKIIDVLEEVPAQPARTVMRKKLVCT